MEFPQTPSLLHKVADFPRSSFARERGEFACLRLALSYGPWNLRSQLVTDYLAPRTKLFYPGMQVKERSKWVIPYVRT